MTCKNIFKSLLSLLLALVMCITIMPLTAIAEDELDDPPIEELYDDEEYLPEYPSQDWHYDFYDIEVGRAGTGSINKGNQDLTWQREELAISGFVSPVQIIRYFNAQNSVSLALFGTTAEAFFGTNWLLNYSQLVKWNATDERYEYLNDNGQILYYEPSEGFEKDGVLHIYETVQDTVMLTGTTLLIPADLSDNSDYTEVTIQNEKKQKMTFDALGRLVRVTENNDAESFAQINYVGNALTQIDKISDGVGREFRFTYTGGLLSKIACFTDSDEAILVGGDSGVSVEIASPPLPLSSKNNIPPPIQPITMYYPIYTYEIDGAIAAQFGLDNDMPYGENMMHYHNNLIFLDEQNGECALLKYWGEVQMYYLTQNQPDDYGTTDTLYYLEDETDFYTPYTFAILSDETKNDLAVKFPGFPAHYAINYGGYSEFFDSLGRFIGGGYSEDSQLISRITYVGNRLLAIHSIDYGYDYVEEFAYDENGNCLGVPYESIEYGFSMCGGLGYYFDLSEIDMPFGDGAYTEFNSFMLYDELNEEWIQLYNRGSGYNRYTYYDGVPDFAPQNSTDTFFIPIWDYPENTAFLILSNDSIAAINSFIPDLAAFYAVINYDNEFADIFDELGRLIAVLTFDSSGYTVIMRVTYVDDSLLRIEKVTQEGMPDRTFFYDENGMFMCSMEGDFDYVLDGTDIDAFKMSDAIVDLFGISEFPFGPNVRTGYNRLAAYDETEDEYIHLTKDGSIARYEFRDGISDQQPDLTYYLAYGLDSILNTQFMVLSDATKMVFSSLYPNLPATYAVLDLDTDTAEIFDEFGRLIAIVDATNWTLLMQVSYADDSLLRISEVSENEQLKVFTYSINGNFKGLQKTIVPNVGVPLAMEYSYENGALSEVIYPDGGTVSFECDNAGRMTSAKNIDEFSVNFAYSSGKIATLSKSYFNSATQSNLPGESVQFTVDGQYFIVTLTSSYGDVEQVYADELGRIWTSFPPVDDECECEENCDDTCECDCHEEYNYEPYCDCDENCDDTCECDCHEEYNYEPYCECDENCDDTCECDCHEEYNYEPYCECDENCDDTCECDCHDEDDDDYWDDDDDTEYANLEESEDLNQWGQPITTSKTSGGMSLVKSFAYTVNGNYATMITDENGVSTSYVYNPENGRKESEQLGDCSPVIYGYDAAGALTSLTQLVSGLTGATGYSNHYHYSGGRLTGITHNNISYSFSYDTFGNLLASKLDGQTYWENVYSDPSRGEIGQLLYANGQTITYTHTSGSIATISYDGGQTIAYEYAYDTDGYDTILTDHLHGRITKSSEHSVEITDLSGKRLYGRLTLSDDSIAEDFFGLIFTSSTQSSTDYATGNRSTTSTARFGNEERSHARVEDIFGRTIQKQLMDSEQNVVINNEYTYRDISQSQTTLQLETQHTTTFDEYGAEITLQGSRLEYDARGNIHTVTTLDNALESRYTYDSGNQLVREDNAVNGRTTTFKYDAGGNLAQRSYYDFTLDDDPGPALAIQIFLYDGNRLIGTSDGSLTVSYDEIGNPLSYAGENAYAADSFDGHRTITGDLSWSGRELIGATGYLEGSPATASYSYDADGRRLTKSLTAPPNNTGMFQWDSFDVNYTYIWSGETFIGFKIECPFLMDLLGFSENSSVLTRVIYNEIGDSIGYFYAIVDENLDILLGDMVWYVKNVFGDITGLFSEQTQALELSYSYDAWGSPASESSGSIFGIFMLLTNQLTYRGYFYDFETGLYYLRSRYYSPSWGRFINADKHFDTGVGVLGTNMYIYCNNNPIRYTDHTGESPAPRAIVVPFGFYFEVVTTKQVYGTNVDNMNKIKKIKKGRTLTVNGAQGSFYSATYDCKTWYLVSKDNVKPVKTVENGTVWFIKNNSSGKYLDVQAAGTNDGTKVQQFNYNGSEAQRWRVTLHDSGFYTLHPMHVNNRSLSTPTNAAASNAGSEIHIKSGTGRRRSFLIVKYGWGYRLITRDSVHNYANSGLGLGTVNSNDGTLVKTMINGGDRWVFEEVNFGSAWEYRQVNATTGYNINCYLYSIGVFTKPPTHNDGIGAAVRDSNRSVSTLQTIVMNNIKARGRKARPIDGPTSDISSNEFRIAMRIGNYSNTNWDYHFWVQTSTGEWAHKQGWYKASEICKPFLNPSTASWTLENVNNYYNSDTLYIAATR